MRALESIQSPIVFLYVEFFRMGRRNVTASLVKCDSFD